MLLTLRSLVEEAGNVSGTSAITEANDTASASGTVTVAGTSAVTEADDSASATGEVNDGSVTGTQATTEANDTATASGSISIVGSSAISEGNDTAMASGVVRVIGTSSVAEQDDAAAATGSVALNVTGTSAITEENDIASASGEVEIPAAPASVNDGAWIRLTGEYPAPRRRELEIERVRESLPHLPRAALPMHLGQVGPDLGDLDPADAELELREGLQGELVAPVSRGTPPAEELAIALLLAA